MSHFTPSAPPRSASSGPATACTRSSRRGALPVVALLGMVAGLAGCGGTVAVPGGGGGGTKPVGPYYNLTGNWVVQATPTGGATPFTLLSGFINELGENPGVYDTATAAFQATPSACYLAAQTIPMSGNVQNLKLSLRSFSVNGQYLTIAATKDATATHLTGTYSVGGGCASGAAGTIAGTEYAALTGTYAGTIDGTSPAKTISIKLTQYQQGTGNGDFFVSGPGTFNGFTCFTTGNLVSTNGSVLGSAANFAFDTNDGSGAQLVLAGSFDPTATTLTLSSINVASGSCSGSYGTATLTRQ